MLEVRVTAADGTCSVVSFMRGTCRIGRAADNEVVVGGPAVSARHCRLDRRGDRYWLEDCGSSNGTWLNHERLAEPTEVRLGDRIDVGLFLVELVPTRAQEPAAEPHARLAPLLRSADSSRQWRERRDRLARFAEHWEHAGRPARLGLRGRALKDARSFVATAPHDQADLRPLVLAFVTASTAAARRRRLAGTAIGLGLAAALGGVGLAVLGPRSAPLKPAEGALVAGSAPASERLVAYRVSQAPAADEVAVVDVDEPISHRVIPFETLADVARRYGVSVEDLAEWNLLNPDVPTLDLETLTIERPVLRPLPQQRVTYEVEPGENWTRVSERFDVPVTTLRTYNPDAGTSLVAGQSIAVWVDPKPYRPRTPRNPLPQYHIDRRAVSVGAPNAGSLIDGIQMPNSGLYTLRKPFIMYGSSYTIANLQQGIARFRRDVDYDGSLIVADIAKRGGGRYGKHLSHQSGRDVDIWLPTLKGVYKRKYLGDGKSRPRKPLFDEVDWYATWGLVRGLIQTSAVKYIFLQWEYQEYVYRAAVNMGTTPEELDAWIQWPRSRGSSRAIFRHSDRHTSHIHVRFGCAAWETRCVGRARVEE